MAAIVQLRSVLLKYPSKDMDMLPQRIKVDAADLVNILLRITLIPPD